ncbi:MAG: hypothetical protein C0503_07505 [Gemmatimonas sp.]|nr:hypothetical protein [Gemmatimonas sp.]
MVSRSHPRPPVDPALLNHGAPDALWTNLGDWTGTSDYTAAATALAVRVGEAASLGPGDSVVDYACGYGDSLRLWVERFGVRRVVGVEPDPQVCERVRARIAGWGLRDRVSIVASRAELLAPRRVAADVTAVVCVDAAYHFRTRLAWWQMLAADLPAGARVAASDILMADRRRPGPALRWIARAMGIPAENLVDASVLRTALIEQGLQDLQLTSIGASVLDGFATHAPRRGLAMRVTGYSLRALRARGMIDYALIRAIRR